MPTFPGVFLYSVLSELFFVETPNDVQDKAFKLVIENDDASLRSGHGYNLPATHKRPDPPTGPPPDGR